MIRVDAHHHVWQVARGDYGWLTPDLPIHRDYGLHDLRPLLGEVSATVLVQAAPTAAETEYLLRIAHGSDGLVRAVVGWADLEQPGAVARTAADPLLAGLRPMLQDIADTGWILRAEVQPGLRAMAARGLRLDALVQPRHLDVLPALAQAHPDLPVVVDHGAKPDLRPGGDLSGWRRGMARLARETGAFCKLSGLVTGAAPDWQVADLRPAVDHLLECFGPERLMWGSDWPVVDLAGGLRRWREATGTLLAGLPAAARDAVLGGTAARFYDLANGTEGARRPHPG